MVQWNLQHSGSDILVYFNLFSIAHFSKSVNCTLSQLNAAQYKLHAAHCMIKKELATALFTKT